MPLLNASPYGMAFVFVILQYVSAQRILGSLRRLQIHEKYPKPSSNSFDSTPKVPGVTEWLITTSPDRSTYTNKP